MDEAKVELTDVQRAAIATAQHDAVARTIDSTTIQRIVRDRALSEDELTARGRASIQDAVTTSDEDWLKLHELAQRPRQEFRNRSQRLVYGLVTTLRRPVWLVFGTLFWSGLTYPGAAAIGAIVSIPDRAVVAIAAAFALNFWSTILSSARRVDEARRDLTELSEKVDAETTMPTMRQVVNELLHPAFSAHVKLVDAGGLEDLFDAQYEVPTRSGDQLAEALRHLRAGSLGLFGPRGAGKSTLMEAAREGRLDWHRGTVVGVTVPAPVRYEAREFIPFLFGRLCLAVIDQHPGVAEGHLRRARRRATLLTYVAVFAVAAAVIALAVVFVSHAAPESYAIAGGYAGLGLVMWLTAVRSRHRAVRWQRQERLLAVAQRDLDDLRFLETQSGEWSGELSFKAAKVGRKLGSSLARQALTLPEVTARYREFIKIALASGRVVVVGIDELDKMASADEAARFLNDVKALFGQPGAYYLVSLSEDAAASFERRGVGIRDVFESVFDQVVRVEPLLREESETMLRRRIIGMEPPFAEVCHMISGGLPRELMRCAREAALIATEVSDVDGITRRLLVARGLARERAVASVAARHVDRNGTQPALNWLRGLGSHPDAAELLRRCKVRPVIAELRADPDRSIEVEKAVLGLAAWWYHAATVMQFVSGLDDRGLEDARAGRKQDGSDDIGGLSAIDLLARGYLDLAVAPSLAWNTVSAFRRRVGLRPQRYPMSGEPTVGAGLSVVSSG